MTFSFYGIDMNAEMAAESYTVCFNFAWHKAMNIEATPGTTLIGSRSSYFTGFAHGMLIRSCQDEVRAKADRTKARLARRRERLEKKLEKISQAEAELHNKSGLTGRLSP